MSSSKSRSPYFYSPLKVECDQKDVMISHMKEEVYHLKRNEQQLILLEQQYRNLEYKYRILSDQKAICDSEFRDRHQHALRTIAQLKNEIDGMRVDLRDRQLEISDMESDEVTLISQLDQRMSQIDKLKNQLNSLLADNQELLNERLRLDQTANGVRKDNEGLNANLQSLQINNDGVRKKMDELDRYLGQLKAEENLLKEKIIAYENQNNSLDGDINATIDDIGSLDSKISNAQNEYTALQNDIADISALSDKNKSESLHYHRSTQAEVMKNNDLTKILAQSQNTLKLRINQVQEGNREIDNLNIENSKLNKANDSLRDDIEYCRKHLQNLALLNSDLVCNLEKYSEEDEVVRNLIDRRARVIRARDRIQEAGMLITRTSTLEGSIRKSKLIY